MDKTELIDDIVLLRAKMTNMETKSKTQLRRTLLKLEKERENNKSLIALHDAKVYEMEMEFEQQFLWAKIAQESESTIRVKYSKAKTTYHKLTKAGQKSDETVKNLQKNINSLERVKEQQNATISGLKLCVEELAQANPSNAQLEEILEHKDGKIETKEKEIT